MKSNYFSFSILQLSSVTEGVLPMVPFLCVMYTIKIELSLNHSSGRENIESLTNASPPTTHTHIQDTNTYVYC